MVMRYAGQTVLALLVLTGVSGCEQPNLAEPERAAETKPADAQVAPQSEAGVDAMGENESSRFEISAAESKEHRLPPAAIAVDLGDVFMRSRKFPAKGVYASMSGPPGAPLGLLIQLVAEKLDDDEAWRRYAETIYEDAPPELGSVGEVELSGSKYPAITFTTGDANARTHHLMAAAAVPDAEQSVVIHFSQAAGKTETPAPGEIVRDGRYADLLQSISVRWD